MILEGIATGKQQRLLHLDINPPRRYDDDTRWREALVLRLIPSITSLPI